VEVGLAGFVSRLRSIAAGDHSKPELAGHVIWINHKATPFHAARTKRIGTLIKWGPESAQ
jgi:hypothetical protein